MNNTLAIVLAAGLSKRMKTNKLLLEYNGKTFLQSIIDKLLKVNFEAIILVVSNSEILKKYENYNQKLFTVFNSEPEKGISESIKKALLYSEDTLKKIILIENYMFFVADQPLLKIDTINKILEKAQSTNIIVPRSRETMLNPVIFPRKYIEELLNLKGDIGGKQIILKNMDDVSFVDIENQNELQDIDNMNEYQKLVKNIKDVL